VRVDLDAVPVGVENLNPYEPAIILPFGLGNTRNTGALARRSHCIGVDKAKAKVVGTGKGCGNRCALGERQLGPVIRTQDQQVLIIDYTLGQAEVLAIEGSRPLADRLR
jgi:hypothetical protein